MRCRFIKIIAVNTALSSFVF